MVYAGPWAARLRRAGAVLAVAGGAAAAADLVAGVAPEYTAVAVVGAGAAALGGPGRQAE